MVRRFMLAMSIVFAFVSGPAAAQQTRFVGTGTVTSLQVFGNPVSGSVVVGDSLGFDFLFNAPAGFSIFDGGNFQVFGLPVIAPVIGIGDYDFQFDPAPPPIALLGTGFQLLPGDLMSSAVLRQTLLVPGTGGGNLPFIAPMSPGLSIAFESTFRQDLGGSPPTLANLRSPDQAVFNSFTLAVGNSDGQLAGLVRGQFRGSFIAVAAVPEPATWLMLILGFAAVGAQMRRRGGPDRKRLPA